MSQKQKQQPLTGMRAAGLAAGLVAGGGLPALIAGGGAMSLKALERKSDMDDEKYEIDERERQQELRSQKAAEKEEQKMIAATRVTSDGLKNGACNFINNPSQIHPAIASVIEEETGVPCNNDDLFAEWDKLRSDLEDALKKNDTKTALRLTNKLTFAQARMTEKIIERSEQQDKSPVIFVACQAAAAHPDDADKQSQFIVQKVLNDENLSNPNLSDQKITKEYSTFRKLLTFNGAINISWGIAKGLTRLLKVAINLILMLSKILLFDIVANAANILVGKNLLAGVAATMVTNPITGGVVSASSYCLSDKAWGITSVGHILSSTGCVILLGGGLISVFGPGSNVSSWLYDLTSRVGMGEKTPPLTTMLNVLNQTLSGAQAFANDIINIFPKFDDMFMVKLYNNTDSISVRLITKFRIFMEICQDVKKGTPVNRVQIMNYVWKNGIRSYNYTKALESDIGFGLSPNNTTVEVATQLTGAAFYNTAAAIASNPYIKEKIEEKFTELVTSEDSTLKKAAISLIQSAAPEMVETISKKLPGIVVNTAREVANSPEFKELTNESNVKELANSVTLAVTDQIVSNVHRVIVSDQGMIAGTTSSTTQKQWNEIVNSATSRVIEYAISNPDKIAETATSVVSVVAPIVEQAATSAISSAFGHAKSEGIANTIMLGALKGAMSTGYHTTKGIETVSYVAGSAARDTVKAAANIPVNMYKDVTNVLTAGSSLASNLASQAVDAGIRTAGQVAGAFGFRGKRSVKKTKKSVKRSAKKNKRSVKKTKKSVKRSVKKTTKRSVKKTKKSTKRR